MIFERKTRHRPRVEIVPMIDITFTIITFFIVFTVFRTDDTAIRLNLPKASGGDKGVPEPVVVTVSDEGGFYVQGGGVSAVELESYLRERIAAHPQQAVVIKADKDVRYQYLVDAMDAIRTVGGSRIALAVQRETQ